MTKTNWILVLTRRRWGPSVIMVAALVWGPRVAAAEPDTGPAGFVSEPDSKVRARIASAESLLEALRKLPRNVAGSDVVAKAEHALAGAIDGAKRIDESMRANRESIARLNKEIAELSGAVSKLSDELRSLCCAGQSDTAKDEEYCKKTCRLEALESERCGIICSPLCEVPEMHTSCCLLEAYIKTFTAPIEQPSMTPEQRHVRWPQLVAAAGSLDDVICNYLCECEQRGGAPCSD
jgi:hypothetical protein